MSYLKLATYCLYFDFIKVYIISKQVRKDQNKKVCPSASCPLDLRTSTFNNFSYSTSIRYKYLVCLSLCTAYSLTTQGSSHKVDMSARQSLTSQSLEASQDKAFTGHYLTVQGFLHGLRKPASPPCQPAEIAQSPKLQSTASKGHEDLLCDSVATVRSPELLDPPESSPSELNNEQAVSPIPEARRLQYPVPERPDGSKMLVRMPRVLRTYTRKIKYASPVRKDSSTSSPTRSSIHKEALLEGLPNNGSDTPTAHLASKKKRRVKDAEERTSAVPRKRKQQTLQDDEEACQKDRREDDADIVTGEKKRKARRKKRRAPINQLALVAVPQSQVRTSFRHHLLCVSI